MIEHHTGGYQYPPLAVFGAGNSVEYGISHATQVNAWTAISYLNLGQADPSILFALGNGPDSTVVYPEPESHGIVRIINEESKIQPKLIEFDDYSTSTIDNVWRLAEMKEKNNVDALGIVAADGHSTRIIRLAKKIIGPQTEFVSVPSLEHARSLSIVREMASIAFLELMSVGVDIDNVNKLEERFALYRLAAAVPKKILRRYTKSY